MLKSPFFVLKLLEHTHTPEKKYCVLARNHVYWLLFLELNYNVLLCFQSNSSLYWLNHELS